MHVSRFIACLLFIGGYACCSILAGCGQIGYMTGGAKDTLAPVLQSAVPAFKSTNTNTRKISFVFDEYIEVNDISANVLVSPYQKISPLISYNRRTVTVKLKDTLLPNTTYTINFGNAIRDLNESNVLRGFTYVFSTGPTIDSLAVSGKVTMAESGKIDSTLLVLLYKDAPDSAVNTRKPDYITRLDGTGAYRFDNLPAGLFRAYALKDGNGSKTYDSPREIFAFTNEPVRSVAEPQPQQLLAFAKEKEPEQISVTAKKEKELKVSSNLDRGRLDLLKTLELNFSHPVVNSDSITFELGDTLQSLGQLPPVWDSTKQKVQLLYTWKPGTDYNVFIPGGLIRDSLNNLLPADTLQFKTKANTDYGRLLLKFNNLDLNRKPVLQFFTGSELAFSIPLTVAVWRDDLVKPAEYELRILYDENGNGKWDPGDYTTGKQPEQVQALSGTLSIRADWDNEREISF